MARYHITGGEHLFGELEAPGAKNSALPILAASLLPYGPSVIENVPRLTDVGLTIGILKHLGCGVKESGGAVTVEPGGSDQCGIPREMMLGMRSSILFMGALLARRGCAELTEPGGCSIGARPVDLHLDAMERLGARIDERDGVIRCEAPHGLHGADIRLRFPSVGATENALIAASTARGATLIHNAAKEPEVGDLAAYLRECGADIVSPTPGVYRINGAARLHGAAHRVIPDRIAAATYLTAVAAAGGELYLRGIVPEHIAAVLEPLRFAGCEAEVFDDSVYMRAGGRLSSLGVVRTEPSPGFPTDAGALIAAVAAGASGLSVIVENIFEDRFRHVPELVKMGADISQKGRLALIRGVGRLHGADLTAMDLRGGAALITAALAADGESTVSGVRYVERGYADIAAQLRSLGARIELEE